MKLKAPGNVPIEPQAFSRRRMRDEIVRWISREHCSHALTLNVNRAVTVAKLRTLFGLFCLEVDRACLGRKNVHRTPSAERLFAIGFAEHPHTNIHLHAALRLDGWWRHGSLLELSEQLRRIWASVTRGPGTIDLKPLSDQGWGRYITKAANVLDGAFLLSHDFHPKL